jgi:hypothetical protein
VWNPCAQNQSRRSHSRNGKRAPPKKSKPRTPALPVLHSPPNPHNPNFAAAIAKLDAELQGGPHPSPSAQHPTGRSPTAPTHTQERR